MARCGSETMSDIFAMWFGANARTFEDKNRLVGPEPENSNTANIYFFDKFQIFAKIPKELHENLQMSAKM